MGLVIRGMLLTLKKQGKVGYSLTSKFRRSMGDRQYREEPAAGVTERAQV